MKLKQIFYITIAAVLSSSASLLAQHYITAGVGGIVSSVSSDKLDNFKESYNEVNKSFLTEKLDGFAFGLGFRPELGYRYINEWCSAVSIGYHSLSDFDIANFSNGDRRKLKINFTALYIESEFGYNWGSFFTNGLLSIYFNRQLQIKNTYNATDPNFVSSFSGTFKGDFSYSTDVGIAAGFIKKSLFIVLKITFPVYTGGRSSLLINPKQQTGLKEFPADYFKYSQNLPYPGVTGDIDGIKLILTFSYGFKI